MPINPIDYHSPQDWSSEPPMNNPQHQHQPQPQPQQQYQVEEEEEEEEEGQYEREVMFEKPLTPSDVGKLNRLVIPKQHAEKYFPLDGDSGDKGLLLSFDDIQSGKPWRFRYSYWNSSQSYVLTKGWSRFIKEKQLDAGDVVLFERLRTGGDRLYIGCRRRGALEATPARTMTRSNAAVPWSPEYYTAAASSSYMYVSSVQQDSLLHAGDGSKEKAAPANSKRLRLFGVNLEYGPDWPESPPVQPEPWLTSQSPSASNSQL